MSASILISHGILRVERALIPEMYRAASITIHLLRRHAHKMQTQSAAVKES
jgi:hypothetical protein